MPTFIHHIMDMIMNTLKQYFVTWGINPFYLKLGSAYILILRVQKE